MIPIFAFSNNNKTIKQLSLTGSVHAYKSSMHSDHEKNLQSIMKILKKELSPIRDLKFVVISGSLSENTADAIEVRSLNT